jgi:two-component system response regulator AlgR
MNSKITELPVEIVMIEDDEGHARLIEKNIRRAGVNNRIQPFTNGTDAVNAIVAEEPDLVFLDVQMPELDGFGVLERLAGRRLPVIVFVTAHDAYALKAFEVHALDYLLKPVRASRLAEAIQRAVALRATQKAAIAAVSKAVQGARQNFSVQERGRVLLVPVRDVIYLKAELKYVTLRTAQASYLLDESLTELEPRLGPRFIRIHRNALVARNAVRMLEKRAMPAYDGDEPGETWAAMVAPVDEWLAVSRRQLQAVREAIAGEGI